MKQILIVGQEPATLHAVEQMFGAKYRVTNLLSESITTEFLDRNQPELLLFEMPNMDKQEELFRLLELTKGYHCYLIMLCDSNCLAIQDKALGLGVADIITKPFSNQLLHHRLNTQLELRELRRNEVEAERLQDAISFSFAELVEFRDESTGGHLKNTTIYFKLLLEAMLQMDEFKDVLGQVDIKDLIRSAYLHDIGKIGISDEVLRKTSPLKNDEFEYMKTHTIIGKQAFERVMNETGISGWLNLARDLAYSHHERWDGSGYPEGLKGEEIPIYARMMSIADVYDALTSTRSYKNAYTHERAMDIIIGGKGTLFDPKLVEVFMNVSDQFEEVLNSRGKDS